MTPSPHLRPAAATSKTEKGEEGGHVIFVVAL